MKKLFYFSIVFLFVLACIPISSYSQEKPIVLVPLATAFLYGDAERVSSLRLMKSTLQVVLLSGKEKTIQG